MSQAEFLETFADYPVALEVCRGEKTETVTAYGNGFACWYIVHQPEAETEAETTAAKNSTA